MTCAGTMRRVDVDADPSVSPSRHCLRCDACGCEVWRTAGQYHPAGVPCLADPVTRTTITYALARHNGNARLAAVDLGVPHRTLLDHCKRHGIALRPPGHPPDAVRTYDVELDGEIYALRVTERGKVTGARKS